MCTTNSKWLNSTLAIVLAAGMVLAAGDLHAQCDYPVFLQQAGADANVMFLFDSSGSMRSAIYHDDYDGSITYSGPFTSDDNYYVNSDGMYDPDDFLGNGAYSPDAPLVQGEAGGSGRYYGNYLNWVFYHATDQQRSELPQVTRIEVEKAVLSNLVSSNPNVRFGVMKFNGDTGGLLVSALGTDPVTLVSQVNAISASGKTPLAEALVDIIYHLQQTGAGAPIQYECQRTFVVVLTDGSPTEDRNVPSWIGDYDNDGNDPGNCTSIGAEEKNSAQCSDYLDDVAAWMFQNDMRPDLDGLQNAVIYTIGFSIDMPLLQEAADNGDGLYYTANNAAELEASLGAIFTDIIGRTSTGSAVAVVSAENANDNRLFRAKFVPGSWDGHLEAFDLPYNFGDSPVWDAGTLLEQRSASSRTMYTFANGAFRSFETAYVNDIMGDLGTSDASLAADIINHTRGEDVSGMRDRSGWKLGDIIDSSPVVVGPPGYFYDYLDYASFLSTNQNREEVIYISSNDGMLHAFRASDGYELWTYIPNSVLPRLEDLTDPSYCHQFFANGTAAAFDIYANNAWKTVLMCGQEQGGDSYFAIDVTDPTSPSFMWDVSLPTLVESWATPAVARVADLDKFVAIVGSGPDAGGDANLMALDFADGSVAWSDLVSTSAGENMASAPAILDINFDGYDDLMYVSDLSGNLWRYDLTTSPWSKSLLFQTPGQPISSRPILTIDENYNVLVYFGTGRYLEGADIGDTSSQTFYCVIDNHSETAASRSDLIDQTSTINAMDPSARGWFMDLVQGSGERVTKPAALVAGVVYFTSFTPNTAICSAGGESWLYHVDFDDGSNPDNDDGSEDDNTDNRVTDLDDGIASQPIFDLGNEQIIIQSTGTDLSVMDAQSNIQRLVVRSWRQIYD